jgi:DNA replication protein DnaC
VEARARAERACIRAGIPKLYHGATVEDFEGVNLDPALEQLEAGGGVFLSGGTGIGKTHCAAALALERLQWLATNTGYDFRWVRCPDLLMEIRGTYRQGASDTEAAVVTRARKVRLLVLDDLGAEKMTDWSVSALYAILSGRVDECRATIVTSNLGLRAINDWEPRIASRLASFHTVKLSDRDRRVDE